MGAYLSRRGLLAAAAAFAVAPFARAEPAKLLTVAVTLAGKGPFNFVVDSGAERTVLADDVAAALGLAASGRASIVGIVREWPADTVALPSLETSGLSWQGLTLPVLPRAFLQSDGYLGLDVLEGHRVTFDFVHRNLEIAAPVLAFFAGMARPDESVLNAAGQNGKLRTTDCVVDGVPAIAFLDSGAEISVANSALYRALSERGARFSPGAPVTLTGITGGSLAARTLAIASARLGGFDFATAGLAVADLPIFARWELANKPALFVGMDFLRHFSRVSIDYGRKQYRLELADLAVASRRQS